MVVKLGSRVCRKEATAAAPQYLLGTLPCLPTRHAMAPQHLSLPDAAGHLSSHILLTHLISTNLPCGLQRHDVPISVAVRCCGPPQQLARSRVHRHAAADGPHRSGELCLGCYVVRILTRLSWSQTVQLMGRTGAVSCAQGCYLLGMPAAVHAMLGACVLSSWQLTERLGAAPALQPLPPVKLRPLSVGMKLFQYRHDKGLSCRSYPAGVFAGAKGASGGRLLPILPRCELPA